MSFEEDGFGGLGGWGGGVVGLGGWVGVEGGGSILLRNFLFPPQMGG